jgi:hypothetical protein
MTKYRRMRWMEHAARTEGKAKIPLGRHKHRWEDIGSGRETITGLETRTY